MNTQDASNSPQLPQILLHKQSLRDAQLRQGQRPTATKSRAELVSTHMSRLRKQQEANLGSAFNTCMPIIFLPPAYPPSIIALHDLKKIMLADLLLETHHRGTCLFVRSVTPPNRISVEVTAIVEDESGDAVPLHLHNQEPENERRAEDIFAQGTVLAIREPYLNIMTVDGDAGLRLDHVSDVIRLEDYDERVPGCWQSKRPRLSVAAWKTRGNEHFNRSQFHSAIGCYTEALKCSPSEDEAHTLKLNRALAFLKKKQFNAALSDLESPSATPKPAEKVLYGKAQALYHLERYRECCETLKDLRMHYPSNAAAKGQFGRALTRLGEQQNARYRFKDMYTESSKLYPPHLDHATYIGPISVGLSVSRGRGLFTTKALKAGDLLLCEKPFARVFVDSGRTDQNQDVTVLINPQTDAISVRGQGELIGQIVQKLYQNPSLLPVITGLHHCSYKPQETLVVDGTTAVDTFLVERVVSLNSFRSPLSSRESFSRLAKHEMPEDKSDTNIHSCGVWPMAVGDQKMGADDGFADRLLDASCRSLHHLGCT